MTGLAFGELGFAALDSFTGSFLPLTEALAGAILDFSSSAFFGFFFACSGARRNSFPGEGGAIRNAPPHRSETAAGRSARSDGLSPGVWNAETPPDRTAAIAGMRNLAAILWRRGTRASEH